MALPVIQCGFFNFQKSLSEKIAGATQSGSSYRELYPAPLPSRRVLAL